MEKNKIKEFLSSFYKSISCEAGEIPNYKELKGHFLENAILAEYRKNKENPVVKSIDNHISEIEDAFRNFKFLSAKGFFEKELSNEIYINDSIAMIISKYEKRYFNGKEDITDIGTNSIQLIKVDGEYKILSIAWSEV